MKKIYLLLFLGLIFFESRAQIPYNTTGTASAYKYSGISLPPRGVWFAIGARIGDPLGVTMKSYSQHQTALEFSFGLPGRFWYNDDYFERRFYDKGGYDREIHDVEEWNRKLALALQVHYLVHREIRRYPGLDWYYGVGGQIRVKNYEYEYSYLDDFGTRVEETDQLTDLDFGPDGVIGLEYTFDNLPLIVFADATLYLELIDNLRIYGQPGIGVRYHF